jgi:LysR family hydrogen peroxide-inducible transcriptional activator
MVEARHLELKEAVTSRLIADVLDGKLDAVVAALPLEGGGIKTQSQTEVDVDRLLLLEEGHCLRDQALAVCSTSKCNLVNFGATSMTTLLQMVSHDMGMTLILEMAIATETGHNAIRIIPFADPQPSREIGLAWRRSNQRESDMRALAAAIVASSPGHGAGDQENAIQMTSQANIPSSARKPNINSGLR